jgi:hypothetical protein
VLKSAFAAIPMTLLVQSASATDIAGAGALALAAIVAAHDPALAPTKRNVMAKLFAEHKAPYPAGHKVIVKADKISCRQSNVAINRRSCELTFGTHTVNLSGRPSHELYATLIEVGVPSDGAAGSIIESLTALTCTIGPNEIRQNTAAGASCTFTPGL